MKFHMFPIDGHRDLEAVDRSPRPIFIHFNVFIFIPLFPNFCYFPV